MKTIFVYGTLKSGQSKNVYIVRDGGKFLEKTRTVPKYRLIQQWLDAFPIMVEDENGISVEGELWSVSEETLEIIDSIEGVYRGLFKRVPIKLFDGKEADAYLAVKKPYFFWQLGNSWK